MTSSIETRFWSLICWRVTTVTDCGVSRIDCVNLPMVSARVVYEPLCSVVALRSTLALTLTAGRVTSPALAGLWGRMVTACPSISALSPLPASSRAKASWGVRRPDTAGAVLPATSEGDTTSVSPAWRARSLSACARGCAVMETLTSAAKALGECKAPPHRQMMAARVIGAGWKRLSGVRERCMRNNSRGCEQESVPPVDVALRQNLMSIRKNFLKDWGSGLAGQDFGDAGAGLQADGQHAWQAACEIVDALEIHRAGHTQGPRGGVMDDQADGGIPRELGQGGRQWRVVEAPAAVLPGGDAFAAQLAARDQVAVGCRQHGLAGRQLDDVAGAGRPVGPGDPPPPFRPGALPRGSVQRWCVAHRKARADPRDAGRTRQHVE